MGVGNATIMRAFFPIFPTRFKAAVRQIRTAGVVPLGRSHASSLEVEWD
jgi:hypothetical protein